MKMNKKKLINQRKIIQQKLNRFSKLNEPMPPSGWLKAIRKSLGLTIRQLADRVGVSHGSIDQIEKREPQKKVTLESLEQIANAMDCKVVYAIVPIDPNETLDDIIKRRAYEAAKEIVAEVSHTMRLEAQGINQKQVNEEISRVAAELISSGDPRIWNTHKRKTVK
jgi:predicted DNA-binding mobile mystery protein A